MTVYVAMALGYDGVLAAVCLLALRRGGRPERLGAAVNLVASVLSSVLRVTHFATWAPAGWMVLTIDLTVAACFFGIAATSTRFWPIWAFGFALADVFASVSGALLPNVVWLAYETDVGLYAYLALLAVACGCMRAAQDRGPSSTGDRSAP